MALTLHIDNFTVLIATTTFSPTSTAKLYSSNFFSSFH